MSSSSLWPELGLVGALRKLRRWTLAVTTVLVLARGLVPELELGAATVAATREQLGTSTVLVTLREKLAARNWPRAWPRCRPRSDSAHERRPVRRVDLASNTRRCLTHRRDRRSLTGRRAKQRARGETAMSTDNRDDERQKREQVAPFRYGLIAELLHMKPGEGLYKKLEDKARGSYAIPHTTRTRVAAETMRGWLALYRKDGFEGLMPRPRKDIGSTRALPQEALDLFVGLKEENPRLTVPQVIEHAQRSGKVAAGIELAPSTVHRLLSRRGLMKKPSAGGRDHRRFEYPKAGDLWERRDARPRDRARRAEAQGEDLPGRIHRRP